MSWRPSTNMWKVITINCCSTYTIRVFHRNGYVYNVARNYCPPPGEPIGVMLYINLKISSILAFGKKKCSENFSRATADSARRKKRLK